MSVNEPKGGRTAKKGLTTKHVVLILGTLLIIVAGVVAVIILTRPAEVELESMPIDGAPIINEENVDQIMAEVGEKVERSMFHTYMNMTWRFPDGTSASSNAVMGNAAENNYRMWFDVFLNGEDEPIFASGLLPLGTTVKEIKLDRDLDEGTYPATVQIHMIDENDEPVESNIGFAINIVIES